MLSKFIHKPTPLLDDVVKDSRNIASDEAIYDKRGDDRRIRTIDFM